MTTTGAHNAPATAVQSSDAQPPWYELISDAPEPPDDAMQQDDTILEVMSVLKARYQKVPDALWCSQINVIYDSNIPGSVVSPDGCIVLGMNIDARVIKRDRRSYRIDEWGVPPAFVLEVASESTACRDLGAKRDIYARMGAQEYWRLDVTGGECYGEPLVGERQRRGRKQPKRAIESFRRNWTACAVKDERALYAAKLIYCQTDANKPISEGDIH